MGKHRRYQMNSSSSLGDTVTAKLSNEEQDFIWSNPNELDLLEMKKSSIASTTSNQALFFPVLPSVRKLQATFDAICPNVYRIHCSDALRTLQEIICLAEEHIHVYPSSALAPHELLTNEKHLEDFVAKLKQPIFYRKKTYPTKKTEIRCFGSGIRPYHPHNELHQSSLLCFELTSTVKSSLSLPVDVVILDPDENLVATDLKYISTHNQGHTKLFSCHYTPASKAGMYRISFFHDDVKVMNQQHMIFVRNPPLNYGAYQRKEQLLPEEIINSPQQGK